MKVALLTTHRDICPDLWSSLSRCPDIADTRVIRSGLGSLVRLLSYGPDLIVCGGFGPAALQASMYRSFSPRSRLLLCAADAPRRVGPRERAILDWADAVLAVGHAAAHAIEQLSAPIGRVFTVAMPFEVEPFLGCEPARQAPAAHRLVHAGDLSPQSGAADLLACVAACAEQQPGRPIEVWWAGEGDLAGVLAAQPLPCNVSQRFLGRLDAAGLAGAFGQCGLLVVPSCADDGSCMVDGRPLISCGMAAGLPVLGSQRSRAVRQLVREGVTGWLFDPVRPADMMRAINRALDTPAGQLDAMRGSARALVRPLAAQEFTDQLGRIIAATMPEPVRTPPARRGLSVQRAAAAR